MPIHLRHPSLAALLLLSLALTGCGDKSKDKTPPTKDTPTKDAPAKDTAPTKDAKPVSTGDKVLRFSAIPSQNSTEMIEKFSGFAKYLEEKLGVKVEYVHSADYNASVANFEQGKTHLAWFGGLTGVQARHRVPGAKAIAYGEEDPNFVSYFIANASTGLMPKDEFPAEIAKFDFTFGSQQSTSGRLMPEYFIRKNTGKSPAEFFGKEPKFSGSHPATLEAVAAGKVPTGVVDYKEYDKAVAAGKIDPKFVIIIWKTPPYADYNFTAHPDLDKIFGAGFTDKLQQAIIDCKDEKLLAAFPRKSLIKANNDDFKTIHEVAKELGFIR